MIVLERTFESKDWRQNRNSSKERMAHFEGKESKSPYACETFLLSMYVYEMMPLYHNAKTRKKILNKRQFCFNKRYEFHQI